MGRTSVLVADPERLFAEALVRALGREAGLAVAPDFAVTGRQLVRRVAASPPDVALVDFWITDMAAPAATRAIRRLSPSTAVVYMSEFFIGPVQRRQAAAAGGLCFVPKTRSLVEVVESVVDAASRPRPAATAEQESGDEVVARLMTLTSREIEVLQLVRAGLSGREAAQEMGISAGTVKNHIRRILVKTGAGTQVEAMNLAEDAGFISAESRPLP